MTKADKRLPGLELALALVAGLQMMGADARDAQADIVKQLRILIEGVKNQRPPRRHRSMWDGNCPSDPGRSCEAPALCWKDNLCARDGTDEPLVRVVPSSPILHRRCRGKSGDAS